MKSCLLQITHTGRNEGMSPHFWIKLPDKRIVDFRVRMWLGDSPDIPHGIFNPTDFPLVVYQGQLVDLDPLPQYLFDILTDTNIL
jgi:hypothetical protein